MKLDKGNIDDYLYEQWKEREIMKEVQKCSICNNNFEISEMDLVGSEWVCRNCEENLENE